MPIVSISCSYLTLMYKKQIFIKNVYGMSFDISEIILRVKSFLCSENSLHVFMSTVKKAQKRSKYSQKM